MKQWLTFLLLLITLAGTFYPCCLGDECNEEEVATAGEQNKQPTEAGCSPFFACTGCSGFASMHKQVQLTQPPRQEQVHHEAMVIYNLTSYTSSFWQPPRHC